MEPVTVWAIAAGMHAQSASAHPSMIWEKLVLIETSHEVGAIVDRLLLSIVSSLGTKPHGSCPARKYAAVVGLEEAAVESATVEQINI
jgi:hypothetical protein